jgi:TonB C terminal
MQELANPADRPRFTRDECALGVMLALAVHVVPLAVLTTRAVRTHRTETDALPPPPPPVIAASLLKRGALRDPQRLPDRVVPQERTAKHEELTASRETPRSAPLDAGPPPPERTKDSDLANLIAHSDPFAEVPRVQPDVGHALGVDAGRETDPANVHAGDLYAETLAEFFRTQWAIPSVITPGNARKLCAVFRLRLGATMQVTDVVREAQRSSGSELFDDSVRSMLLELKEQRTPLPPPPSASAAAYRNMTVDLTFSGDPQGDASRCGRP